MKPCRIVIVEDEAIVAMDIEERLIAMGYESAGCAATGEQALTLIEERHPDLILMDIHLQGNMDGIAAAIEIRKRFLLPVILLTAYSEETMLERAKLAEPYGYILKPFDDRELKSAIEIARYRHGAEREIRRLNRLYNVLSQVNQSVVRSQSREELLPSVCHLVVERGGIDLAWIGWLDEETTRIRPIAYFGKQSQVLRELEFFADDRPEGQSAVGRAVREGKPFVCNECGQEKCSYPATKLPVQFGFRSWGSFPLHFQGRVCGVFSLCTTEPGFFREREIELLKEVAFDISFALEKIEGNRQRERAENRIVRQNAILEGINRIFREALSSHTKDELMRACLRVAEELTESHCGFLGEVNGDERLSEVVVNNCDCGPGKRRPTGSRSASSVQGFREMCNRLFAEGKGFFTNDPSSSPDRLGCSAEYPPFAAFLCVPLVREGRIVGALGLGDRQGGFREQDLAMLEAITPAMVEVLSRKEAEDAFWRSEMRLRTLVETIPDLIWLKDANGFYIACNAAFERFFGAKEKDIAGKTDYDFVDKEMADWFRKHDSNAMAAGGPSANEEWLTFANGGYHGLFETIKTPMRDTAGQLIGVLGISRDVTERNRVEAALRESEARLRLFFECAPVSLAMFDREMRYLSVSQRWLSDYRLSERNLIGLSHYEVFPEIPEHWKEIHQRGLEGEVLRAENDCFERADGSVQWLRWEVRPWWDDTGDVAGIVIFSEDISERKRLEEERLQVEAQLKQAQKMEALGTLAGGIAHDFNNILGIIVGFTDLALLDSTESASVTSDLQEVVKAANRAKDLVQQILAFSRLSEQEMRPVQIGLIVKEAMKMLRASLPTTIDIKVNVTSKSVMLGDPTQIHQVLMNLCTNAAHAMQDGGGVLQVDLTDTRLEPEAIMPHCALPPGAYLKLTVRDTGEGIDPRIVERIFDPFFTTKEQGVGTGLGLSVVHGIVKSHGGSIQVQSHLGAGTTFEVLLPALERQPVPEAAEPAPLPRGRERILVVDDEPALGSAIKQMLERLGYEVDYRRSGPEALEVFQRRLADAPFALVITDMTMPRRTGLDLSRDLLAIQPTLPILLCTGFHEKINAEKVKALGIRRILMKPVAVRELAEAVREALENPPQ